MLYYDEIDVSEEIYINKTSASKRCNVRHYWYFLDKGFKFGPYVCNSYHDELMMSINLSNIAILNINDVDYHGIITRMSKSEAVNLLQKIYLNEKTRTL